MNSRFLLAACAAALLASIPAFADTATVSTNPPAYTSGTNTQSMTPSGGLRTQPQDGAGHDVSASHPLPVSATISGTGDVNITEVGGNAVTTTVPVSGTVASTQSGTWKGGTYEFNASVIPTVQNAAYAAGQSLGGLQTISVGSTNSLTGMLNNIRVGSKGGSTVSVVAYVWSKNPSGTTCTDKTNFAVSQTDNAYLVAPPQLISLATVVSAQDATTYGAVTNLAGNFLNGSTNTNLYVCLLANASVTPATTSDYRLNLNGFLDVP